MNESTGPSHSADRPGAPARRLSAVGRSSHPTNVSSRSKVDAVSPLAPYLRTYLHTVVARSRRGGKSTHRAQPNGSSRRSPLNAQLSATGVCHDVPDLRRRSTRQQRLHHVDSRVGFPAGEPPGRQVPSIRFSPVEGGASNDVEDPRTDPPRIPFTTSQPNKSRKRCSDDTDEAAMSAANSKRQQSSPLGSVTNLLVHGTEQ